MSWPPWKESGSLSSYLRDRVRALWPFLWANWLTTLGSMLSLTALVLLVGALFLHTYTAIVHHETQPYVGLVVFMILPAMLMAGLVLVLAGNLVQRSRIRRRGPQVSALEVGGVVLVRKVVTFGLGFAFLLVILASFSYEAYHFTDSKEFCLEVCHEVMAPEGVAYERSPHSRVACVSCHIGPGASWFVRSKLSGLRQVVAVLADSYQRPIPTPVHDLRPARETCEVCHWPEKFHGSRLVVREHFRPDAENTPTVSALVMKIGGIHAEAGVASGIHWHVDPRNEVRYRHLDEERMQIVEVVQTTPAGEIRYVDESLEDGGGGEWRTMDCIDCHNRPTHIFQDPAAAVDAAMAAGRLDRAVPWLRREAVRVLHEIEPDGDTATLISARLAAIYAEEHPEAVTSLTPQLAGASAVLAEILDGNVFPQMNITWGTYPNNLSHFDEEGDFSDGACFRCHDEEHVSEDGLAISQDCDNCHAILAERERNWGELADIGEYFLPPSGGSE